MAGEQDDPQPQGPLPPLDGGGVGNAYAYGQLVRAFLTALTHDDPSVRESADRRTAGWRAVLAGIADGRLSIGSRRPVADLPEWATAEVLRGGFATGAAQAAGGSRAAFDRALTEAGLAELHDRLVRADYGIGVPEHAALLTIAWLVGARDFAGAQRVAETIAPYSDRLDFTPARAGVRDGARRVLTTTQADATAPPEQPVVWRATAGEIRERLAARAPRRAPTAQREALLVWNPFADEVLALWLRTCAEPDGAGVGTHVDDAWRAEARTLLDRYAELAATHRLCSKHRRPKANLAILLDGLRATATGRELDPRRAGLLQTAVVAMVARRGAPGTPRHAALRALQRDAATAPTDHAVARIAAGRLQEIPPDGGLRAEDLAAVLEPVTAAEAETYNMTRDPVRDGGPLAAGTPVPLTVERPVRRARAGTLATLVDEHAVTSAETLAELAPRVVATTVAAAYADEPLRTLMAATYLAFRWRRSVLLLDLQHQVRIEELPWVAAVAPHRLDGAAADGVREDARRALAHLVGVTLTAFPQTIVPSALTTELEAVAAEAGLGLRLVPELAADIFQGLFSPRFLRAAQAAAPRLRDSLYARYYDIDYTAIEAIDDLAPAYSDSGPVTSRTFDALCRARAGQAHQPGFPGVAGRGCIIEQSQILTTHNLDALVDLAEPPLDHAALALRAFRHAGMLSGRLRNDRTSLRTVKNLAYAWRQGVFFASLAPDPAGVVDAAADGARLLASAYAELRRAARGAPVAPARRVLGWTDGEHWLLAAARP